MTTMTRTIHTPTVSSAVALHTVADAAGVAVLKGFATLVAWQGRYVEARRVNGRGATSAPVAEALRAPAWNG